MTGLNSQEIEESLHKRKLILQFDQHNTIQVACTLPGRSLTVEEGLNNFLTSAVWGREVNAEWEWVCDEPQIQKPPNHPDAVTYFKYVEKKIVNKPDDRAELKKITCNFVYEYPGNKFRKYFDIYLRHLKYTPSKENNENETGDDNDSGISSINENLLDLNNNNAVLNFPSNTLPGSSWNKKELYNLILPDFFDMIRRLQRNKRDFTIVLRTMGIESMNFLDTVRQIIEGKHEDFKDIEPMQVNPNIGQIIRDDHGKISLFMDNEVYEGDEEIVRKLNSLTGINAIRDDFAYWQKNDYSCFAAKPLWIDLNDSAHHHILFDDNIRLDSYDDCIVNIRLKLKNLATFKNLDFKSYSLFEKCCALQPNLIELLKNSSTKFTHNLYYEKIHNAEIFYNQIVENQENLKVETTRVNETNQLDLIVLTSTKFSIKLKMPNKVKNEEQLEEEIQIDLSSKIVSRTCNLQ